MKNKVVCDDCGVSLELKLEPIYNEAGNVIGGIYVGVEEHDCEKIQKQIEKYNNMLDEYLDISSVLKSFKEHSVWGDSDDYDYSDIEIKELIRKSYVLLNSAYDALEGKITVLEEHLKRWEVI